jgi:DNA-binding Xre family transcriptional regulator
MLIDKKMNINDLRLAALISTAAIAKTSKGKSATVGQYCSKGLNRSQFVL